MYEEVQALHDETALSIYASANSEERTYNKFRSSFNEREFARTEEFNELVVSTYLDQAKDRRSTLVRCATTKSAASLTELFVKAGIEARYVDGTTPKSLRKSTIRDFRLGLFPVLVNCKVFTEGADMPAVSNINDG
jgi:superfamily II DNA or RNA helicase